jgi:dipeptidase E
VLDLSGKPRPRICFVPTASGDSSMYITRFYEAFVGRAEASHLGLFGRPRTDTAAVLAAQDIVYVGGGNTANMLAVWRVHGVDRMLRAAWERGVILTGVSAGMICWFEAGVTDSFGPLAALRDGLGILPGSGLPALRRREGPPADLSAARPRGVSVRLRRRRRRGAALRRRDAEGPGLEKTA